MFLQQTFASVRKVLPAVIAPLVLAELDADPAWVGVYYGLAAAASLVAQVGCGSFIGRYGALRMSQSSTARAPSVKIASLRASGECQSTDPVDNTVDNSLSRGRKYCRILTFCNLLKKWASATN
jgi:hypothetical protein